MNENKGFPTEHLAHGLQIAREYRGISLKEAAERVGITTGMLKYYESGKYNPSLPTLEALSFLYHFPLHILLSREKTAEFIDEPDTEQLQQLTLIRHKIISTTLSMAFENSGMSLKELTKATSIPSSRLKRYLDGEAIPLNDLISLSGALNIDTATHQDRESQLGIWQFSQIAQEQLASLPKEIQEFLRKPESKPFIDSAYALYSLPKSELESLAGALHRLREIANLAN